MLIMFEIDISDIFACVDNPQKLAQLMIIEHLQENQFADVLQNRYS